MIDIQNHPHTQSQVLRVIKSIVALHRRGEGDFDVG
jgi:hypothetical protein